VFTFLISLIARRNAETGDIVIEPKNVLTSPVKKGKIDKVYFDKKPSYIAVGK
jgi:hypothetical protein